MTAQKAATAPTGFLGLQWGDDAAEGARRIGLTCDRWEPWIDPAFETSMDLDHPRAVLDVQGVVGLVRDSRKQLVGVQVIYRDCATNDVLKRQLRDGLRRDLHVKSTDDALPYEVWPDHSLVRLATRRDGVCILTVAGPDFGKPYADQLVREGVSDLGSALTPH